MSWGSLITFPFLQPCRFVRAVNSDDRYFKDSVPSFQKPSDYTQLFQTTDKIKVLFGKTSGSLKMDADGNYILEQKDTDGKV